MMSIVRCSCGFAACACVLARDGPISKIRPMRNCFHVKLIRNTGTVRYSSFLLNISESPSRKIATIDSTAVLTEVRLDTKVKAEKKEKSGTESIGNTSTTATLYY